MPASPEYPRNTRNSLTGEVLIKRKGKPTLKANKGNVSDGGLYLELLDHDLQKGKRVELIFVTGNEVIRDMDRMTGVVIRIDDQGVAMVTYKPTELRRDAALSAQIAK